MVGWKGVELGLGSGSGSGIQLGLGLGLGSGSLQLTVRSSKGMGQGRAWRCIGCGIHARCRVQGAYYPSYPCGCCSQGRSNAKGVQARGIVQRVGHCLNGIAMLQGHVGFVCCMEGHPGEYAPSSAPCWPAAAPAPPPAARSGTAAPAAQPQAR